MLVGKRAERVLGNVVLNQRYQGNHSAPRTTEPCSDQLQSTGRKGTANQSREVREEEREGESERERGVFYNKSYESMFLLHCMPLQYRKWCFLMPTKQIELN